MFKVIVFCALFGVIHGQATNISQCTISRDAPLPVIAHVHGCINPPCLLPQGENVVIDLVFRAPRKLNNLATLATITLNAIININIPYDLGATAVTCDFLTNASCPLNEGQIVKYRLTTMVERFFPVGMQTTVEFRIVDMDKNQDIIACLRLPIKIIPATER